MLTCPKCSQASPASYRFCGGCGAPLPAGSVAGRQERKVITVVFIDLVGFTARSERLDPEDVREVLDPYYRLVKAELERHGGTVEKFIGDAVMAVFGAPQAHEDDPERAVRAALAIRDLTIENESDLQLRIGINTGEALVSVDAQPSQGEAIVAGDVVNTAARLEAAAPEDSILVGDATQRATAHAIDYAAPRPVRAKGKAQPLRAWPVLSARSQLGVDLVRYPRTPFVGRDRDLQLLSMSLARVREEQSPQLVTIIGAPGMGKSRLVYELSEVVDRQPDLITWRQGRSPPYGSGVTFWALSEMVKAQAGILETDSAYEAARKLDHTVTSLVADEADTPWIGRHLHPLAGLTDVASSGHAGQEEAFSAWLRFLEALAAQRPAVLVFEDLHWADDALLDFVEYLVDWASHVPLLVLGTARPELLDRRPGWGGGKPNASTMSLAPLGDGDIAALVGELLGDPDRPAPTKSFLDNAGGNPLYAEQFARMMLERDDTGGLPESVQGVIAARLDALPASSKALLQDAAVVGKVFWSGALGTISGAGADSLRDGLHALERGDFVQRARRSSVAGQNEFTFRHVLVRDVAYGQIPRLERADKHRRAAEWLAGLSPDRLEDRSELLAHHYRTALDLSRSAGQPTDELHRAARDAFAAAGARAWALDNYTASARFYQDALGLASDDDPAQPQLRFAAARARYWAEGVGLEEMSEAVDALRRQDEREAAAEAASWMSWALLFGGQRDAAYRYADMALELTEPIPESAVRATALARRSTMHMLADEDEAAMVMASTAIQLAERLGRDDLRARLLINIGMSRFMTGDSGGLEQLERATAVARAANAHEELEAAYKCRSFALDRLGRLADAEALLPERRRNAERHLGRHELRWVEHDEVVSALNLGRWSEVVERVDRLIAAAEQGSQHYLEASLSATRAFVRLARGEPAGAEMDARRAVELARPVKDPQAQTWPLLVLAMVTHAAGRRADTNRHVTQLLDYWESNTTDEISLACLMTELGRAAELADLLAQTPRQTAWIEAATAIVNGEPEAAADDLARIGAVSSEAVVRLHAARRFVQQDQGAAARVQLERCLELCRRMGASGWAARAEELLASTALTTARSAAERATPAARTGSRR
jgi:class 3 adenylate cyclase